MHSSIMHTSSSDSDSDSMARGGSNSSWFAGGESGLVRGDVG